MLNINKKNLGFQLNMEASYNFACRNIGIFIKLFLANSSKQYSYHEFFKSFYCLDKTTVGCQ